MTSAPSSTRAIPCHLTPGLTSAPPPVAPGRRLTILGSAPWLPSAALVTVAVVWGVTFTVVDGTAKTLPAPDLVLWRFGLASLVLGLVAAGGSVCRPSSGLGPPYSEHCSVPGSCYRPGR